MRVVIDNKIYVQDPTHDVIEYCQKNLILANPEFYKKEKMGKWTGNTPRYIYLYEQVGNNVILPFGCLREIWKYIQYHNSEYFVKFCDLRHVLYHSNINLYQYQETAAKKAINAKNGILVMPCGAGKTQTALQIVAEIGGRALWLTHTKDLLNQSMQRAKDVFDLQEVDYGVISEGKIDIGSAITFATIQTLSKIDLSEYRNHWDVIIVDECQHCCGTPTRVTQFYKVLSNLSARYKIGLTATPKRADGLEKSMFALLGDVIYEVSRKAVAYTTCPIKIEEVQTGYVPDYNAILTGDGTINYSKLLNDLIENEERFEVVKNKINNLDGSILVLSSRVRYAQRLSAKFKGMAICLSTLGNSKSAKAHRKEALQKLNNGKIKAIFTTYQLAKEGLDVPSLRYVVFATPEKDETTIIQSVGRVARKADGKEYGTVIDFIDNFGMYKGWAKKRKNFYKKIGCDIANAI